MKELTNIISETLGVDYIVHETQTVNSLVFTTYKEHKGDKTMVIKNYSIISPLFNNLTEAAAWINSNL